MTKLELKSYRDNCIINQFKQGITVEDLAYIYNISSRRVQDVLKTVGIQAKVDLKIAEKKKSTKVQSKK